MTKTAEIPDIFENEFDDTNLSDAQREDVRQRIQNTPLNLGSEDWTIA